MLDFFENIILYIVYRTMNFASDKFNEKVIIIKKKF